MTQGNLAQKGAFSWKDVNRTRLFVVIQGTIGGLAAMIHGINEIMIGNTPTAGLVFDYRSGAFSILPTYLISGIAAVCVGLALIEWTIGFIHRKNGPPIFLFICILLFLVGGGKGVVVGNNGDSNGGTGGSNGGTGGSNGGTNGGSNSESNGGVPTKLPDSYAGPFVVKQIETLGGEAISGIVCSLTKPFNVLSVTPHVTFTFYFLPQSAQHGKVAYAYSIPSAGESHDASGTYSLNQVDKNGTLQLTMSVSDHVVFKGFDGNMPNNYKFNLVPSGDTPCP